jgi:hypothetical protein
MESLFSCPDTSRPQEFTYVVPWLMASSSSSTEVGSTAQAAHSTRGTLLVDRCDTYTWWILSCEHVLDSLDSTRASNNTKRFQTSRVRSAVSSERRYRWSSLSQTVRGEARNATEQHQASQGGDVLYLPQHSAVERGLCCAQIDPATTCCSDPCTLYGHFCLRGNACLVLAGRQRFPPPAQPRVAR